MHSNFYNYGVQFNKILSISNNSIFDIKSFNYIKTLYYNFQQIRTVMMNHPFTKSCINNQNLSHVNFSSTTSRVFPTCSSFKDEKSCAALGAWGGKPAPTITVGSGLRSVSRGD